MREGTFLTVFFFGFLLKKSSWRRFLKIEVSDVGGTLLVAKHHQKHLKPWRKFREKQPKIGGATTDGLGGFL